MRGPYPFIAAVLLIAGAACGDALTAQTPGGGVVSCRGSGDAAGEHRAALEADPDDVEALNAVAWIRLSCGAFTEAEELYRRALVRDPANRDALMGLGLLHLDRWELAPARASFGAVLERFPGDPDALRMLSEVERRHRLRVEVAGSTERVGDEPNRRRFFVGAGWRPAWNLQVSGAYFRNDDLRFGTSPSGALEQLPGVDQGLVRGEYRPGKFSWVGASSYFTAGERAPWGGAGVDGGVVLSRRVEALARADYFQVPGGELVVVSPTVIVRHPELRDAWSRIQYFRQEGIGLEARADVGFLEAGFRPLPDLVTSAGVAATRAESASHAAVLAEALLGVTPAASAFARYRASFETDPASHLLTIGVVLGGF